MLRRVVLQLEQFCKWPCTREFQYQFEFQCYIAKENLTKIWIAKKKVDSKWSQKVTQSGTRIIIYKALNFGQNSENTIPSYIGKIWPELLWDYKLWGLTQIDMCRGFSHGKVIKLLWMKEYWYLTSFLWKLWAFIWQKNGIASNTQITSRLIRTYPPKITMQIYKVHYLRKRSHYKTTRTIPRGANDWLLPGVI